ncbi:P2Y purinoceptor 8-like isoform X1 [Brienomyrus brachyistius]|uniref:P2Y purinoceptor 8-like isoform X1 n=2 Tax=Brienomyrus brachyistius TaxID=42636 RepID=UPI0020B1A9E9|nr:P2Y purinoceptor 8-like isoform X1 [Brienomyrus brachyistius]XP_048834323.1 P2Y purinoceptor 8-like isoform X1 [Brienomyrus brachyistius]
MDLFNNSSSDSPVQNISTSILEMVTSTMLTRWVPVVYLLVFIVSTPCNIVSLWLLYLQTKSRNPTIIFAINLSLTDLIYSAFLPFQMVYHFQGNDWPFGRIMCSISTIVFYCNMNGSILTTCAISLERYFAIVHPLRSRHYRTTRNALLVCLLIWTLVLSVQVPVLHNDITFRVHQLNITTCFDILPKDLFSHMTLAILYFGALLFFFFMVPLLVLVGSYASILKTLCSSRHRDMWQSLNQTIGLIVVVMLCFVFCYLPNILLQTLHLIYIAYGRSLYVYYKLSLGLNSLSCCIDPFIYYFASREFRQKLHRKLLCWSHDEATTEARIDLTELRNTTGETSDRHRML